jgi:hypothetical protein
VSAAPALSIFGPLLCRSCAATLLLGAAVWAQDVSIQLDGGAFRVQGWTAPPTPPAQGWQSVFAVYAGPGGVPPMLGSHAVQAGRLVFRPAFPLAPGVRYRAVFRPPGGRASLERVFDGPPKDASPLARVERVYPSGEVLPSNQLRLYIYFSAPMSHGEAAQRIRVLDENGKPLNGVFLPGEELWDPTFQRLTMTFDPGRIKRGLTSNESIGPPLDEGKRYALLIDRGWPDARGAPMIAGFRKTFRGGPEARHPPDPKQWRVTAPQAGTLAALTVDFPSPMNYVLLLRMLRVSNAAAAVEGVVAVDRQETRWLFTPKLPWKSGSYQLIVNTKLEDLAGNHIGEPFDIDAFQPAAEHATSSTTSLPFRIR